jgi:hypothetical protein
MKFASVIWYSIKVTPLTVSRPAGALLVTSGLDERVKVNRRLCVPNTLVTCGWPEGWPWLLGAVASLWELPIALQTDSPSAC